MDQNPDSHNHEWVKIQNGLNSKRKSSEYGNQKSWILKDDIAASPNEPVLTGVKCKFSVF